MQGHDWNDLRYLLALHRTGTLADAAQRTGVAETTVARRLKRLEQALGIPLFVKADQGRYRLTDPASAVLDHAEAMEAAHDALRERLGQISDTPGGPVRISSVPVLINRILAPAAADLDGLIVELIPEPRAVDLTKREADLALRFARPDAGGLSVKAQRIATLAFGVFAAAMIPEPGRGSLPWITYADSHGSLPQARWTEALRRAEAASPVVVCDIDTAIEAAASGAGLAVLPALIGQRDPRLARVPIGGASPEMIRDVWLLTHADQAARPSITAAKAWLTGALAA